MVFGMGAVEFAALTAWLTIGQWLIISSLFVFDAWRVHFRTARALRAALGVGNGRIIVARIRNTISWWYIVGSMIALGLGLLGAVSAAFLDPPPPDTRIVNSIIREGIVVMLFSFWRTKRLNVVLFRLLDARRDEVAELEGIAEDTNERVREIQKRGQHDQREEEADRKEGRRHRHPEESGEG